MTIKRYSELTRWERKEMRFRVLAIAGLAIVYMIACLGMNMTYQ